MADQKGSKEDPKSGEGSVKKQGTHARINQCYDFAWSRGLWKKAASRMTRSCVAFIVLYLIIAVVLAQRDGLEGVDIYYFIITTVTTIGLGDISPQNQLNRSCAIIVLPYGLVVIGFGISTLKAYVKSLEKKVTAVETKAMNEPNQTDAPDKPSIPPFWAYLQSSTRDSYNVMADNRVFVMLFKYCFVLAVGIVWFMTHPEERSLQQEEGVEMTFIDAAYFSTVLSTMIGYGHMLKAQHDDTKWFLTFYMLWSTIVIGTIIGDLSSLYLEKKGDVITATLIRSTTYVHQCDLFHLGRISESDYVLFKLQQMQMLDEVMLRRLTNRFSELDVEKRRLLIIGQHIPSAAQVKKMKKTVEGTSTTLIDAWKTMRLELSSFEDLEKVETTPLVTDKEAFALSSARKKIERKAGMLAAFVRGKATIRPKRVSDVHDFSWPRKLWKRAAYDTLMVASLLLVAYVIAGWNFLVDTHSRSRLWKIYFLSATLSTVGLGDIAPTTQDTRLAAIFLLPLGLIIIGFVFSYSSALDKSRSPQYRGSAADTPQELEMRALFDALDANGDGILTQEECIAGAKLMSMTEQQARNLYQDLDPEGTGAVKIPPKHPTPWLYTVPGKCWILFFKMYALIAIGALYFKIWEDGAPQLSWIDAAYFATVVSSTIGYGDIVPESDSGRIFMSVYMLVSTVIVGKTLSEFIDVYVNDVVGEKIVQTLIDSTTWIHCVDIDNRGVITEADYVLFKLMQMMKVDADVLDMLIDRFEEIDDNGNGWLDIGIDVPSAEQVAEMNELPAVKKGKQTLVEAWEEKQKRLDQSALRKATEKAIEQSMSKDSGRSTPVTPSKHAMKSGMATIRSRESSIGSIDSSRTMSPSVNLPYQNRTKQQRRTARKKRVVKMTSSGSFSDTNFFEEIRMRDRSTSLDRIIDDYT